jgi:predicted  nucleic acid-binding Zn-ribbon protein
MEDMHGQQLAYNTHLDTIRADHERTLALEIEKQIIQNQSNLEQLRKDLSRIHSDELEEKERAFGKELSAVRIQLDRALEITKIKEREADLRIEDLTSDLNIKQKRIDNCLRDLNELQDQIEQLRNDIELRSKELQRVRNETQKEMK